MGLLLQQGQPPRQPHGGSRIVEPYAPDNCCRRSAMAGSAKVIWSASWLR